MSRPTRPASPPQPKRPASYEARILLFGGALFMASCETEAPTSEAGAAPAATTEQPAAPPTTPAEAEPKGPRVAPAVDSRVAASHVLVSWQGAVGARPNITRSKAEAQNRAQEALSLLKDGKSFKEVAKGWSDDSTGPRGGSLGGFGHGTMVEPFEKALRQLQIGELSGLVETPFGYHIIRRDAVQEVHVAHLLVTWSGAERAPPSVSRSQQEASARAQESLSQLVAGASWEETVRRYSDGPLSNDAGDLGWFGRGQLATALDDVAFNLDIGATSEVVETARGYHILRRLE